MNSSLPPQAPPQAQPPVRSVAKTWLEALKVTEALTSEPLQTLPARLDAWAASQGSQPALLSDEESFTYEALAARARQYARWALSVGLKTGDGVGLLMGSRPEYVALWLGLTRQGVVVSLLNPQLPGAALAHCLRIARPRHVIVSETLAQGLADAASRLDFKMTVWRHGASAEAGGMGADRFSGSPLQVEEERKVHLSDTALQIYTSGTTGMPKAAKVSHRRILTWSGWFAGMMGAGPQDRLYNCLPLHHSVGGVVAVGGALAAGASVVLKARFSAREFWADIVRWDCTLFQYIGELCRYLLAAPISPDEDRHRLRLACGNGLRADVWTEFQSRFQIPQILEFYASTEGNFSLFNVEGRPGAIGRHPPFLSHRFGVEIVRFDPAVGAPYRGEDGFCRKCPVGEAGEAIGRIAMAEDASGRFEGYTNAEDNEKKILRDVFQPGDAWFRSGDLMRMDAQRFYYFVDRIGDTFRWKGENVSTLEVAVAICACPGVQDAVVYGVSVPGADGKAGMASLVVGEDFRLEEFTTALAAGTPAYARPVFLRIAKILEATETFKPKKQRLADEGFNPGVVADALYVSDQGGYRILDPQGFEAIMRGEARF